MKGKTRARDLALSTKTHVNYKLVDNSVHCGRKNN
jgi:hypothetical protein